MVQQIAHLTAHCYLATSLPLFPAFANHLTLAIPALHLWPLIPSLHSRHLLILAPTAVQFLILSILIQRILQPLLPPFLFQIERYQLVNLLMARDRQGSGLEQVWFTIWLITVALPLLAFSLLFLDMITCL